MVYTAIYFEETPFNWKLEKVILNSDPTSFPENIAIEFTNENEGNIVVQFPQQEPRSYPFSKLQPKQTRISEDDKYYPEYSFQEEAIGSFLGNTIVVDLEQVWLKKGQIEYNNKLSYEFVLQDDRLDFKNIKGTDNPQAFTATYFPVNE